MTIARPSTRRARGMQGLIAAAAAMLSLAGCGEDAGTATVLKVHHFVPLGSTIHKDMIAPWCEKLALESDGALRCQIFPAMQLGGNATQLYDQAREGVVDIAFAVPGFTAGRFPRIEVFELPFMMRDAEASSRALWRYVERHASEEFADVRPLAFNVHGPGLFHTVDRPIRTRADLAGLSMRAPTRQSSKLLAALGATPVGMPLPQVPEALSRGVIDGLIVPWEIVPAIKADELTRHHSETPPSRPAIYTTAFVFAMNRARYEALPAAQRAVLDANSGLELSARFGRVMQAADALGRMSVAPASITLIDAGEIDRWQALTRPVIDAWVSEMNARGHDGAALLVAARALSEEYAR